MEETELWIKLAFEAGQQLVKSVDVGTTWRKISATVARILGHGDTSVTNELERQLEEERAQLVAATSGDRDTMADELAVEWRVRLKDALKKDPEAVRQLQTLLAEFGNEGTVTTPQSRNVVQNARDHGRNYYSNRDINLGGQKKK